MLDEADFITRYDKTGMLTEIERAPEQLEFEVKAQGLAKLGQPGTIVLAAMGGSALAGEFIKSWVGEQLGVPFVICRDYELPGFVGPETLVVASSNSGNTEETLSALADAEVRGAQVVVMAAGGKLLEAAKAEDYSHVELTKQFNPRTGTLYGVKALACVIERVAGLKGLTDELSACGEWLKAQEPGKWAAKSLQSENEAKQIASALVGHPVVVYSGPVLAYAAMKWKIALNENAKNLAFYNFLPELNHNELTGWGKPERSGFKVVELQSDLDHERVKERFVITNRLRSNVFAPIEVQAEGKTKLHQLVWASVLGDFVSVYLGALNQVDLSALELVDKLKRELG